MPKLENVKEIIQRRLPTELVEFLRVNGVLASRQGLKLYLVGGVVRDLLLERANTDLDLVVEGDAIVFARELAKIKGAKVIANGRFNTAKIKWERWSVDIASARTEFYRHPGELPTIEAMTDIRHDLQRRDFTINAMAVQLDPEHFGEIIDVSGGRKDLAAKLIRVLHPGSFQDDATRIWRAVRFEQRLDFRIENHTHSLILKDLKFLDTLSSDRMRNELELCLEEAMPEKVLSRAAEIGIFRRLAPSWQIPASTFQSLKKVRVLMEPYVAPQDLYLAVLFFSLDRIGLEALIERFSFGRSAASTLRSSLALKDRLSALAAPGLTNA
jgi:tRNA nucleotidyltransferase (CCA-adding enzyme)